MKRVLLTIAILLSVSGCSSFSTGRYSVATENVVTLREANIGKLSVGTFTSTVAGQKELTCRGMYPIRTADGEPYAEFVRKALVDDLRMAGSYSATSPKVISGNIDSLDFSSMTGFVNLAVTVKMSDGTAVSVTDRFTFPTGLFDDENACSQAAQAFIPTVQNVLGKVIRSAQFTAFAAQ